MASWLAHSLSLAAAAEGEPDFDVELMQVPTTNVLEFICATV
jgi:hypothetical protein